MKQNQSYMERQPDYKYQELGNGYADVFIFKFIEERIEEEDNRPVFIYDTNEFRVNIEEIPEELISADPLSWLTYDPSIPNISLEERMTAIEDAVMEMSEVIFNG